MFLKIGKTIIYNVARPMQVMIPLTLGLMIIYLWLVSPGRNITFWLGLISFLLLVITTLITVIIEVPIDNQIREWTVNTMPSNWERLRERWEFYHTIRTFTSIFAFGFFMASTMAYGKYKLLSLGRHLE
jgi:uncharacterized membrane protein